MNAYTYTMPIIVSSFLTESGYDVPKIVNAIQSNGNDNLKLDKTQASTRHGFKPERYGKTTTTPASSTATVNHRLTFTGKGNAPEEFAAWADSVVAMEKKFGVLTEIPLPVRMKTWLDAKFILGKSGTGNGKGRRNGNVDKVETPAAPGTPVESAK